MHYSAGSFSIPASIKKAGGQIKLSSRRKSKFRYGIISHWRADIFLLLYQHLSQVPALSLESLPKDG